MPKTTYMIQMNDLEAADMLRELAKEDIRSFGSETAWLIRQEHARRFSFDTEHNKFQKPMGEIASNEISN